MTTPPEGPGWGPAPGSAEVPPGSGTPPGQAGPPAYGPGGSPWQGLPPEEGVALHQPGVIPLRPLSLADVFGGALATMRRNPEATVGLALLVLAVLLVPSLLLGLAVSRVQTLAVTDVFVLTEAVRLLMGTLATLVLSGLIIYVVSEAALGDRVGIGQAWARVRGRLPALVGVSLLTTVAVLVAVSLVILLVVLVGSALPDTAGLLVAVLLVLASVPLLLWLGVRLSLAPGVVVLERVGPVRGLSRSWSLTRGGAAWRILGISLLATLVTSLIAGVLTTPATFLAPTAEGQSVVGLVTYHLLDLVVGALITPFTAGVTALLYLDQRIRREGLDLAMARAARERAAARRR